MPLRNVASWNVVWAVRDGFDTGRKKSSWEFVGLPFRACGFGLPLRRAAFSSTRLVSQSYAGFRYHAATTGIGQMGLHDFALVHHNLLDRIYKTLKYQLNPRY